MIYLDNAATTKLNKSVLDAMMPYLKDKYGNASAIYVLGIESTEAIWQAKKQIAQVINADPDEIYFTSGGTESDNWALVGSYEQYGNTNAQIITSTIEHHAILNTCEYLKGRGAEIVEIPVDKYGVVDLDKLKASITPNTALISIMFANNEIGTIQPIKEIGMIADEYGIPFHTDAVQAFGQIPIDVKEMGIDMLSGSAHKIGGPKGVGFLYVKDRCSIKPFIHGGRQELGKRAGTENVPGIVGFGVAAEMAQKDMIHNEMYLSYIRNYAITRILDEIEGSRLNGHDTKRLPNNINISFSGINGETLLVLLEGAGICASSGSACASLDINPSHVLKAIGLSNGEAFSSLRLTMSSETTVEEIDYTIEVLKKVINNLRKLKN